MKLTFLRDLLSRLVRHWELRLVIISIVGFISILLIGLKFDQQQTRIALVSEQQNADALARQIGSAIENEMNRRLVAVEALVAYHAMGMEITQDNFNFFASALERDDEYAIALQFAPDGIVTFSTKADRNASAFGHDLLGDPKRAEMAYEAIDSGRYMITGPIDLIQGGTGLIARKPIYNGDQVSRANFWGFASVVLDFDAITDLITDSRAYNTHEFALRDEQSIIWGDVGISDAAPCLLGINLATGQWQLAVVPRAGWSTAWPFATYFRIATVIVAALFSTMLFSLLKKPKQLRRAVDLATQELTVSARKLKEAHRIVQLGSWETDADGTVLWSDEALEILGLDRPDEPSGIDVLYDITHEDDVALLRSSIEMKSDTVSKTELTIRIKNPNRSKCVVRLTAIAFETKGGNHRFEGTLQDITTETLNAERLRRAQKLKAIGQLTGGVAHDFNNLLAVVQGNAELMEMGGQYDQGLLDEIKSASNKGAALTHRLLAYARKQSLSPEPTNLIALVQGMYPIISRSIGEDIKVEMRFSPELWWACIDPGQIENAILNLAINARDAMPNGGNLLIEIRNVDVDALYGLPNSELPAGQYVLLEVADTGTGMTQDVQTQAFEPFFSTKGVGKGSGLGLSMVSGLARQSGGDVDLTSAPGQGTAVKIYLPRSYEEQGDNVIPFMPDVQTPKARGETILVIEDNPSVKRVVVKTLVGLGYTTLEADTVESAYKLFIEAPDIDLVLSDIILPGGASGLDFAERAKSEGRKIRIVFMSGFPVSRIMEREPTLSDHTLLRKPFSRNDLAVALRQTLDSPTEVLLKQRVN